MKIDFSQPVQMDKNEKWRTSYKNSDLFWFFHLQFREDPPGAADDRDVHFLFDVPGFQSVDCFHLRLILYRTFRLLEFKTDSVLKTKF